MTRAEADTTTRKGPDAAPPVLSSILMTTGQTPLVRMTRLTNLAGLRHAVALKLETTGPTGSSMDRVAAALITGVEASGQLATAGVVIECGTGNLGVALAAVCSSRGYRLIFVTDDRQSQEKLDLIKAYGAEVLVCPHAVNREDPRSKGSVAQRLSEETPNACYPRMAESGIGALAARSIAQEILSTLGASLTHVFLGVCSGATLSGVGGYLKEFAPWVHVVGVEPEGSVIQQFLREGWVSEENAASFRLEEIGAEQPPEALDPESFDQVVQVGDADSIRTARSLAREEGVLTGGAGGATVSACLRVLAEAGPPAAGEPKDPVAVCLVPDRGSRYLSKVFNDAWLREHRFLEDPLELTAAAILARERGSAIPRLVAVSRTSLVIEAVELMKRYGISQIPVIEGDDVVGSVREGRLIHLLLTDPNAKAQPIRDVLDEPFPVIEPTETIEAISILLTRKTPAVLIKGPLGLDILTKADLIRAIAR
ncbi:MAG: pyridoxal-phosphate dependent enzyme [Planctomycetota bacterium]|jgi:cystathionine beta-synthase